MVKVQKPQAKSLNKTQKIEGISKDKLKASKEKKSSKAAAALAAASVDVSDVKKVGSKKADIKNVAEKTVKKATKDKTAAVEKPEKSKPSKKVAPTSPASPAPKAKGGKKALVAAPPTSPATPAKKAKGGKKALVLAPTPSPVAPAPKAKGGKKALVVAPTPSPVAAAPKSKGAKKAQVAAAPSTPVAAASKSKGAKKALVAAPTPSPVAAPKPKGKKEKAAPVPAPKESQPASKKKVKDIAKPSPPVVSEKVKKQVAAKAEKKPQVTVPAKETSKPAKPAQNKQSPLAKGAKKAAKQLTNGKAGKPVTKKVANIKGKGKSAKKQKETKVKKVVELKYELKPFDEDKFYEIVNEANVQKVCDALKTQVSEEVKKQKASIFSDYRYILQVSSYKIPSCPKRIVKLALKNSLVGSDDDVAIIVTDLQRGARFDYEPTVQHYEDLFREAGVEQRLSIVPFNRLRNDMGTYEAKRKFLNTYDYLLCDGRISGQANAFLGQGTQKPRNVLHAVRLSKEDQLQKEISRALCRTAYRQLRKGDLTAIPVGNHEHSGQQLAENIVTVVNQLQQHYPGSLANIRSIYLKIDITGTSALPLYLSLCSPPADAPYVVGPSEQRMLKLKKQANEVLSRFALTKDVGFVKLTPDQVKYKAEVREKRLALKAADAAKDDDDEEEAVVPAKKARKEAVVEPVEAEDDDEEEENDSEDDEEDEEEDDNEDDDDDEDEEE